MKRTLYLVVTRAGGSATRLHVDGETGVSRRHRLHESVVQQTIREAVRVAGIRKPDCFDNL